MRAVDDRASRNLIRRGRRFLDRAYDADDAFAAVAALLREEKAVRMTKTKTPEDAASSSSENEPARRRRRSARRRRLKKSRTKTLVRRTKEETKSRERKSVWQKSRVLRRRSRSSGLPARRFSARRQESGLEISASQTASADSEAASVWRRRHGGDEKTRASSSCRVRLARRDVVRAEGARGFGETRRDKPSTAAFGNAEVMACSEGSSRRT